MLLTEVHLDGWLDIVSPDNDTDTREQRKENLRRELDDPAWRGRRFVALDDNNVCAVTWYEPAHSHKMRLGPILVRDGAPIGPRDASLVHEVVDAVQREGASVLEARIPIKRLTAPLEEAFISSSARSLGERIEYRTPLDELPSARVPPSVLGSEKVNIELPSALGREKGDTASPLQWAPVDLSSAAALYARCAADGPDALRPDEDPYEMLSDYLADPTFTRDPALCLHAGSLDGVPVALVCAQVKPATGWSTLMFMGLVPEARGRGLGHVVQQHGISMLRAQGGRLYHGGTSADNAPMRACFTAQGCREWRTFKDFVWIFAEGA